MYGDNSETSSGLMWASGGVWIIRWAARGTFINFKRVRSIAPSLIRRHGAYPFIDPSIFTSNLPRPSRPSINLTMEDCPVRAKSLCNLPQISTFFFEQLTLQHDWTKMGVNFQLLTSRSPSPSPSTHISPLDFTTTERSVDTFQLVTVVLVSKLFHSI